MRRYRAALIGVGQIGSQMDYPGSKKILTHAHAYKASPNIELVAMLDINQQLLLEQSKKWHVRPIGDIDTLIESDLDIISVAVDDKHHYEVLKQLLRSKARLVIAEKPVAHTYFKAKELVADYQSNKMNLLINYSRRFLPDYQYLKNLISSQELGGLISGSGFYGKGLLHYGSHMINLLSWFFGDIEVVNTTSTINDNTSDDPTIGALLDISGAMFMLNGVDSRNYQSFELDLWFENGRIRLLDAGQQIEIYKVKMGVVSLGIKSLYLWKILSPDTNRLLYYPIENAYQYLKNKKMLNCTGTEALSSELICYKIRNLLYEKNTTLLKRSGRG